jgi:hypothetical protein
MKQITLSIIIACAFVACKNKCATCKSTITTKANGISYSYSFVHEECGANLRAVNGKTKKSSANGMKSSTTTNCY